MTMNRRDRLEKQMRRTRERLKKLDAQYKRESRREADSRKFLLGAAIQAAVERDYIDEEEVERFRVFLGEYIRENDPRARTLQGTAFEPIRWGMSEKEGPDTGT